MANASADRRRSAGLLIRIDDGAFAARLFDRGASAGVRARVLGVLRWRRALDHALEPHLDRPLQRLDPEVRTALRMGCFEATRLGVPAPVATDAMIRLVRQMGKSSASGLVNAVLRRALASNGLADAPPDLEWSHPEWLWRRWARTFGEGAAVSAMAAAQQPAPPWVWFVDEEARSAVEAAGADLEAHPWCPGTWTAATELPALMSLVSDGVAVVQDPSSQLVALLAAGVSGGRGRAVDLCAAPGGKTALMLRLGQWQRLVAADRSPARAVRLGQRLGGIPVIVADATWPAIAERAWDVVLLDAPCSGTGTLRRHPELKWRLTPDAITEAADRQRSMIGAALPLLAPEGLLLYATCSVEPEENEAHFETISSSFDRVDLEAHVPPGVPRIETGARGVRILPHEFGDGFTVHAVRRRD